MRCMMFSCLKGLIIVHIRQLIRLGNRKAYVEHFILFLSVSASTPCWCLHSLKMCCSGLCDVFMAEKRKEGTNFWFCCSVWPWAFVPLHLTEDFHCQNNVDFFLSCLQRASARQVLTYEGGIKNCNKEIWVTTDEREAAAQLSPFTTLHSRPVFTPHQSSVGKLESTGDNLRLCVQKGLLLSQSGE